MAYAKAAAAVLLCACTVNNPLYSGSGDGDGGGVGGDLGERDGGGRVDLAGVDLSRPGCVDGEQHCRQGVEDQLCVGGKWETLRVCPMYSLCTGSPAPTAFCQPPSQVAPCDSAGTNLPLENECFRVAADVSCQPFVVDPSAGVDGIVWRCDVAVNASGVPGTPCTLGTQCRSGFCGSNGSCFRACLSDQDCPIGTSHRLGCRPVTIDVEGMTVMVTSCIPIN